MSYEEKPRTGYEDTKAPNFRKSITCRSCEHQMREWDGIPYCSLHNHHFNWTAPDEKICDDHKERTR